MNVKAISTIVNNPIKKTFRKGIAIAAATLALSAMAPCAAKTGTRYDKAMDNYGRALVTNPQTSKFTANSTTNNTKSQDDFFNEMDDWVDRPDPEDPTNTNPTNPDPTNPDPTNPTPTNPDPTNPTPTNPDPTNPTPTNPDPTNPAPTNPDPTNPTPTNPTPTNPTPTNPTPTNPTKPKGQNNPVAKKAEPPRINVSLDNQFVKELENSTNTVDFVTYNSLRDGKQHLSATDTVRANTAKIGNYEFNSSTSISADMYQQNQNIAQNLASSTPERANEELKHSVTVKNSNSVTCDLDNGWSATGRLTDTARVGDTKNSNNLVLSNSVDYEKVLYEDDNSSLTVDAGVKQSFGFKVTNDKANDNVAHSNSAVTDLSAGVTYQANKEINYSANAHIAQGISNEGNLYATGGNVNVQYTPEYRDGVSVGAGIGIQSTNINPKRENSNQLELDTNVHFDKNKALTSGFVFDLDGKKQPEVKLGFKIRY
jgi:hypothetical protein